MRLLLVVLIMTIMLGMERLHINFPTDVASRAALVFGFLLLIGFLLGEILVTLLPRITAYLLTGMILGPYALGMVDHGVIQHLGLVDELALVLIALTAGAELKLDRLKDRAGGIASITLLQSAIVFGASAAGLWMARSFLAVFENLSSLQIISLAGMLGIIATATSPSTAVAIIVESKSTGPMTDSVLGVTVLKDIVVLVGFSLIMGIGAGNFTNSSIIQPSVWHLILDLLLSLVSGVAFGLLMIAYLRFIGKQTVLFVAASAFLLISISRSFSMDALLVAIAAGFSVGNFSRQGKALTKGLEKASGPVFLIFFCIAGAGLNLGALQQTWRAILIFVGLRTIFTWLGTGFGAWVAKEPPSVRSWAWTGFLGQAGVSLGLAAILRNRLGGPGSLAADIIIGAIVINQIVGPTLFRWALIRTKEATVSLGSHGRRSPASLQEKLKKH